MATTASITDRDGEVDRASHHAYGEASGTSNSVVVAARRAVNQTACRSPDISFVYPASDSRQRE